MFWVCARGGVVITHHCEGSQGLMYFFKKTCRLYDGGGWATSEQTNFDRSDHKFRHGESQHLLR